MAELVYNEQGRLLFTEEMRQEYTILVPQMLPIHFSLIVKIFNNHGYRMKLLTSTGRKVVDEGLRNVHNDTCYPALLVIGQMMDALKSGEYDIHKTALMITQTGGGCRASNYINLLRKALKNNKMEFVPVVSLNIANLEKNPGFKLSLPLLQDLIRRLRKAKAKSDATRGCGVHIHISANGHTAQTLRNLANIMASHESLIASALNISQSRIISPHIQLPETLQIPSSLQSPSACSSVLLYSTDVSALIPAQDSPALFGFDWSAAFPDSVFPAASFSPELLQDV